MKIQEIVYESGDYYVVRVAKGFEVYKNSATCGTRCAVIGYLGDKGLQRAKQEIERRAERDFRKAFTPNKYGEYA